jgi:GT2 family glycosyltransferase
MCDLLNKFTGAWNEYGDKHGLDTDEQCLEHAIRASVILVDADNPAVFDWRRYLQDHPDVQRRLAQNVKNITYADATCHYLNHGLRENRKVYILGTNKPYVYDFDWKKYDELNPDIFTERNRGEVVGKWHCFRHWCEFGYMENRKTTTEKQIASVNADTVISTDVKTNQSWLRDLRNIINIFGCKTTEDLIVRAYMPISEPDNISNIINPVKLSVVILCFNQLEYTKQCIESVLQNTICDSYEVVVVNNGSIDGTNEYLKSLRRKHANVKIIYNTENIGFSKGMNIGARYSCGEYIILLNNDTIVDKEWDYSLINTLKTNVNAFAVTPITNSCGNEAMFKISHTSPEDYFKEYHKKKHTYISHFNASSLALFCGCFKHIELKQIGFLDEKYLNGCEDDDLYNRILLQNRTVLVSTQSVVYHFGSVKGGPSAYSERNNANQLYYESKWRFPWKSDSISNINKTTNLQERLKHINVFIFLSTHNLDTLAIMIQNTLRCINIDSTITYKLTPDCVNDNSSIYIILYNDRRVEFMPKYYIFYQIEQFSSKASPVKKFDERYYKDMNNALAIFEFSKENITYYKKYIHDQSKIFYLPFPFSNIYDISFVDEYKYDIVFFCARSSRRQYILDKLYCKLSSRYRIKYLYGVSNKERDDILKQSKCVLNLHYYPDALLEIERINAAINCNCIVISETSINGDSNEYYDFIKYFDVFTENEINNGSSLNIDRLINCIEYNLEPVKFNTNITELQIYKCKLAEIGRFFYQKVFLAVDQFSIRIDNNNINYPLVNIPYCVTLFENNTRYNIVKSNAYTPSHYKFPAMKYKKGAVGCAMSYKILCYNAERLKLPSIVIFEDDCLFKENFAGIYSIIYNLKFVWDIINFYSCIIGYGDIVSAYRINDTTYILKVKNVVGTVCNLYNKSMYKYIYNFPFIQSHYNEDPHNMEFHIDRRFHIKDNLLTYCVWPFVVDILDTDSTISNSSSAYKWFKNQESKTNDNVCRFIANNPDKIHKLGDL